MVIRTGVCVIVSLVALGSLACSPGPGRPFVAMIGGNIAKEGSFEDCVYQTMKGGMKLEDALKECAKLVRPSDYPGTGLNLVDLLGAARIPNGRGGVTASDCYGDWNSNAPIQRSSDFREAQRAYMLYLMARGRLTDGIKNPAVAAETRKVMVAAYQAHTAAAESLTDEERVRLGMWKDMMEGDVEGVSPAGDWTIPNPEDPAVARPVRDSESLCQKVAELVGECNRDGWRSPDCKDFLERLNGCLDRTVADPADPSEACSIAPVDPKAVRDVVMLRCWSVRKPVPGEDPCSKTIAGQALEYYFRTGGGEFDPCTDPHVRRTGEDCYPTFTLVKFGEVDIQELVKWGQDKLGGPIVVIPRPAPDPGDDPGPAPPNKPAD